MNCLCLGGGSFICDCRQKLSDMSFVMTNRRFPVAGTKLTIPWEVAERAIPSYAKHYGFPMECGRTTVDGLLETLRNTAGFTESELDAWAPDWREHAR